MSMCACVWLKSRRFTVPVDSDDNKDESKDNYCFSDWIIIVITLEEVKCQKG